MIEIRSARIEDAADLVAIYAPYVEKTAITFETQVPTVNEFASRIEKTLGKFPYLVAVEEGKILGYAYASTYYARAAYDWTVELSVYIQQEARGKGIGSMLYDALEEELTARGFKNFLACIALPNPASISLHEKRGYEQVAHFKKVGYKFGSWHDIVWLQKSLVGDTNEN
ncbi:TPA: N-acetyltransferase [Streptococcus suis]|nr:N-acetyltransferase [Streptococcus suis]